MKILYYYPGTNHLCGRCGQIMSCLRQPKSEKIEPPFRIYYCVSTGCPQQGQNMKIFAEEAGAVNP